MKRSEIQEILSTIEHDAHLLLQFSNLVSKTTKSPLYFSSVSTTYDQWNTEY